MDLFYLHMVFPAVSARPKSLRNKKKKRFFPHAPFTHTLLFFKKRISDYKLNQTSCAFTQKWRGDTSPVPAQQAERPKSTGL